MGQQPGASDPQQHGTSGTGAPQPPAGDVMFGTMAIPNTGLTGKRLLIVFVGLGMGVFVMALSETIAGVALPTICGSLNGIDLMQWVETTFVLTSTFTMPIYGRLGDTFGRKRLLIFGLGLYALGKLFCGLAPAMWMLLLGRAVSGLGGGGLMILSQAIMADVTTARQRGTYMGAIGAVFSVSNILGPVLGGFFVDVTGWRWIFWFTVPIAVIAMFITAKFLPNDWRCPQKVQLDVLGSIVMTLAVCSVVFTSAWGGTAFSWTSWQMLSLIALTVVFWVAFVLVERRASRPIMPLSFFKDRNFTLTTVCNMIIFLGMDGTLTYFPTYLEVVNRLNPMWAGLMMIPMMVGSLMTSVGTGLLATKTGRYKWMLIAMCAVTGVGYLLMGSIEPTSSLWLVGFYLFVWGFGSGLGSNIITLVVQNEFPHEVVGTATAATNFFSQISNTIGTAWVGGLFTSRLVSYVGARVPASVHLDLSNVTPQELDKLAPSVQKVITDGYWNALIPLMDWFIPLLVVGLVMMCFVKNHRLATTIDGSGQHQLRTTKGAGSAGR